MADVYEFAKSNMVQGVGDDTPYVSKQWQYVNDINSGVYSNNGTSLVQFDLSSIYNSNSFVNMSEGYFVIPITYVQAFSASFSSGVVLTPTGTGGDQMRLGLKSGFFNLVHACEIMVNGQTLESYQPFLNAYTGFKIMSNMSQDDLNSYGFSLGMGNKLDNPESLKFNNNASQLVTGTFGTTTTAKGPLGGNGISNNFPYSSASNFGDQSSFGLQNSTAYNTGLFSRLNRIVDLNGVSGVAANALYGSTTYGSTIQSATNVANEFRPSFQILNTGYMVWYDYAVIRIGDILDSMNKLPLMKKFDGIVRLSLNVGVVGSQVLAAGVDGNCMTSATASTFTNTCPLIVPAITTTQTATTVAVASGLFIGRATTTNQFGINLGTSGASNPMNACRFYFPQIVLKPERSLSYVSENRNKVVSYTSMLYNQASTITAGATYSSLIQSGVSNIKGVLILPFISASTHGLMNVASAVAVVTGITPFSELLSPFSCAPMQTAPISLINLNVSVGGQNVCQNFTSFGWENFLEQVSLYDKINSSDLGLSCGLINEYYWSNAYRSYYIDCSRGSLSDGITPRNVNISFNNNSQQVIDCLIFVEYYNSRVVDVESGLFRQ
jgi:hypothetical protein